MPKPCNILLPLLGFCMCMFGCSHPWSDVPSKDGSVRSDSLLRRDEESVTSDMSNEGGVPGSLMTDRHCP